MRKNLPQAIDRKNSFHTIIEQGATMTDAKGDKIDIDTPEPAPLTQREKAELACFHGAFGINHRALARLRWLEAEVAALKKADPLAEMWRELSEYQPQADRDGHGESWAKMCSERTEEAAWAAYMARQGSSHVRAAAYCVWQQAQRDATARRLSKDAVRLAADALAAIRRAKEER
jgi:hypothetical protein